MRYAVCAVSQSKRRVRFVLALFLLAGVGLVACAAPSSQPSAAPSTTIAPDTAATLCGFATPAPAAPGLLPAPVYFLGSDSQIWRLDTDGSTLSQITHETAPVRYFDVSPANGALAYIVSNMLVCADSLGGSRTLLVQGPTLANIPDDLRLPVEMNRLRWSPDGGRIAYGLNGVNVYDLASGASSILLQNDAIPANLATPTTTGQLRLYSPAEWSPDGSRLLVNVSYYPEGGGLAIFTPGDKSFVPLASPDGLVCCFAAWSSDSSAIYFANDSIGMVASGLWRADAATGNGVTLIPGEASGLISLVAHPYALPDGQLAYFLATTAEFPQTFVPLTMTRSDADGVSNRTALRADSSLPYEALWASDGSGAVIVDRVGQIVTEQDPYLVYGPFVWLKADGSAPVLLPAQGFAIRWGK